MSHAGYSTNNCRRAADGETDWHRTFSCGFSSSISTMSERGRRRVTISSRMRSASFLRFGISGKSIEVEGGKERCGVPVGIDSDALSGHIIDNDGVDTLAKQLGAAVFQSILGLGREPHDELAGASLTRNFGEDVFSGREFERERAGALELVA